MNDEDRLRESRQYWDNLALSFDDEPDHGLNNPLVLASWTEHLTSWLPLAGAAVLDIGCGTGSLSIVMARLGCAVTGIDISPSMLAAAQAKAEAQRIPIEFHQMDAAFHQFPGRQFDVILCRHLLWSLPEPKQVLQRWTGLLKQEGRLILIEGFWETGSGLHAKEIVEMLPPSFKIIHVQDLSAYRNLWGKDISDERYAILADIDSRVVLK